MNDKSNIICLLILLLVVSLLTVIGVTALQRGDVRLDVFDELGYMNGMQTSRMLTQEEYSSEEDSVIEYFVEYIWEVIHSFEAETYMHKAPGWRLASLPVVSIWGVDPTALRIYSFLFLIPSALFLYFGLQVLLKPVSALIGTLFLCTAQGTLVTLLHWYQEMLVFPFLSLLIWALFREIRYGDRQGTSWIFLGVVFGVGLYSKITFAIFSVPMLGSLFIISGWMENPTRRRLRIFWSAVLGYVIASFWWPSHFLYSMKHVLAPTFMRHGTENPGWERFALFLNTHFSFMLGFWNTLLLVLLVFIGMALLAKKQIPNRLCFKSNKCIALLLLLVPILISVVLLLRGNSFNPRFCSPLIPLYAGICAILCDRVFFLRASFFGVFGLVALQFISLFTGSIRPETPSDIRWAFPFRESSVKIADYSLLQEVAPLGDRDFLSVGYVGSGLTFSMPAIIRGYYPNTHRISSVNLSPTDNRDFSKGLADEATFTANLATVDVVVIPYEFDPLEFEDSICELSKKFYYRDNSRNKEYAKFVLESGEFDNPIIISSGKGFSPVLWIFIRH